MILEIGQSLSTFEWVRVTAEYSNAVLVAVLPYISDVSQKLDLPVPHPVVAKEVVSCSVLPRREVAAEIEISGGWIFAFDRGHVRTIQSKHAFSILQNPDEIPSFYGELKMSKAEAVQMARANLKKLGIALESVFAEQEPQVVGPKIIGTNTVPHYRVSWLDPRGGTSVEIEINGNAKRVERIQLSNGSLDKPPPKVGVIPPPLNSQARLPVVNPEYAWRLVPIVLRAIDDYGLKLGLPIPQPLTTNQVDSFHIEDNGGWPHCTIKLTNGWRFTYRNSMVNGYEAPDNLFVGNQRPILIKNYAGKWNMTESEARQLVRHTLEKLNYPTNLVHFEVEPQVSKPAVPGIPRFMFYWYYNENDDLRSTIWAEVDADKREVKSLYYDDKAYWNRPPPIDVPITLPLPAATNKVLPKVSANAKTPQRPFKVFSPPGTN